jgi:hypothetical protein
MLMKSGKAGVSDSLARRNLNEIRLEIATSIPNTSLEAYGRARTVPLARKLHVDGSCGQCRLMMLTLQSCSKSARCEIASARWPAPTDYQS